MVGFLASNCMHLVINKIGEIQALTLIKGNVDDRKPVPNLTKKLTDYSLEIKDTSKKIFFTNYSIEDYSSSYNSRDDKEKLYTNAAGIQPS